jgi:uncharacterized protein (TIGR04222 family)
MNPFDLHGPEFLVFYFLFAAAVIGCIILLRRRDENHESGKPPLDDPYLVAYLRSGEAEAVRVAALSLFDRGLLTIKSSGSSSPFSRGENRLELTDTRAIESVRRPLEKRVLEAFKTPVPISTTLELLESSAPCLNYARNLEQLGLLPGEATREKRKIRKQIAIGLLLGVAILKILIAISRGRTNVLLLIILAILAACVTARISNPFRTARGDKFLADVKSLFASIRSRSDSLRPGGATSDLVWLASAYGLTAVPTLIFPHVSAFFPRKPLRNWGSTGSGDSGGFFSSCGSTSCGGGGCGGGGCGGGGCGGCGS